MTVNDAETPVESVTHLQELLREMLAALEKAESMLADGEAYGHIAAHLHKSIKTFRCRL